MKKIVICLLAFIISLTSFDSAIADYDSNPLELDNEEYEEIIINEMKTSVYKLSALGIVNDPLARWSANDYMSRRNAFEMVYIVFKKGSKILCSKEELNNLEYNMQMMFSDVEPGTYDIALAYGLSHNSPFLNGKYTVTGHKVADFDGYLTYNDAFVLVSRLLNTEWRYSYGINKILESDLSSYYDLMCDLGLVNSNTIINYSTITVNSKDLNNPITAYEFMHLLYNAMYVPHMASSDYGNRIYGYRYIDDINIFKSEEMKDYYIYIH